MRMRLGLLYIFVALIIPDNGSSFCLLHPQTVQYQTSSSLAEPLKLHSAEVAAGMFGLAGTAFAKLVLDQPSRPYHNRSVGKEYDNWTEQGIVEYYWGENIHLGFYSENEDIHTKGLNAAQYSFIDQMMKFGGISQETHKAAKVLDVGCGFGGTTRFLSRRLGPESQLVGITLSPKQVERARELAVEQRITNVQFQVEDALHMESFGDDTFDIVWACESGEHMPDKKLYIEQMLRVLKPGGNFVMATWCQRDDRTIPFDGHDLRDLTYLYEEWSHPYFISKEEYVNLLQGTGEISHVRAENWAKETIPTWRHTIWMGIRDPWGWITKPGSYLRCIRDAYCLERMHRAFHRGLMEYGMIAATKHRKRDMEPFGKDSN